MYYPLMVQMQDMRVVIVGGGRVALRKIRALAGAGAAITVIAPRLCPELRAYTGQFTYLREAYRPGVLDGASLAVACTDDREVNLAVWRGCGERGIPVCVCDSAAPSDFIFPAVATRGALTVAVSTGGGDPALAKEIKNSIMAALPEGAGYGPEEITAARGQRKKR